MNLRYGLISVDDHVQETPNLWIERLAKNKWHDRVPHIEQTKDGAERWVLTAKSWSMAALLAPAR